MLDELDVNNFVQVKALAGRLNELRIFLFGTDLVRKEVLVLVYTDQSVVGFSEEKVESLARDVILLNEACLLRLQVNQGELSEVCAHRQELAEFRQGEEAKSIHFELSCRVRSWDLHVFNGVHQRNLSKVVGRIVECNLSVLGSNNQSF